MTDKLLLLELSNAARGEARPERQQVLKAARISLSMAITMFASKHSTDNLIKLNGSWSLAERVLKEARAVPPPSPVMGSGEQEGARLAA